MNIRIDTKQRIVWLSYEFLMGYGIPEGTINWWSTNDSCRRICVDGRAFLDYDTIPVPTRAKLPTKEAIKAEYRQAL